MDAMLIPTFLCPKAWEGMSGNETTRFCSYCKKHVHNLEAMSVSERLALLASPAATICSRYKVAIRRPARGKKESYLRHMMKYGAGVALTGSVLLVLWEMHEQGSKRTWYRASGGTHGDATGTGCSWPAELYDEREAVLMGAIALPDTEEIELKTTEAPPVKIDHVDLNLDPTLINTLLNEIKSPISGAKPTVPSRTD